ncbi:MAG: hypothetical protein PVF71_10315, partial [Desulfobacterales bacterium]
MSENKGSLKMKSALIIPILAILSGIALFIGAASIANAGHHGHSMFSGGLNEMDSNNDGAVSFDEYSAYHTERLRWGFNALDTNSDGLISSDEWETFLKMHGAGG